MNTKTMLTASGNKQGAAIVEALMKLRQAPVKAKVDLVNIAKKLSSKKFTKK
jgi:hypothetical protein